MSSTTRTIAVGGADLTVREWGSREGAPLLYWHGLNPFGALELNEAGPAWAELGFRVVSFAAPGIAGGPAFPDLTAYRPSRLADLVVETADRLGIDVFAYAGWSWGASIGVHLGVRHDKRLRALVLLDAGHTDIPGDPGRTLEEVLAEIGSQQERYRFDNWEAFLTAARQTRPRWRPELEERLRAGMHEVDGAVVARSDRRAAAAAWHGLLQEQPSSTHAALGTGQLPVLLVLASRSDTVAEVERFRAAVPRADVLAIDSGHDLLADAPEETIAAVASWLGSIVAVHSKLPTRMPSRRFSQAIAEGDGISVIADVADGEAARAAEAQGAEAVVVRARLDDIRKATELPILWRSGGAPADAARAGADALLVVVEDANEDEDRLARVHAEALELGLDCVVEVRSEEELEFALERVDPEIFLLAVRPPDDDDAVARALELLPDVPAGKLAVADVPVSNREQVNELERAGVDAVIVGARDVAGLVGDAPPQV